MKSEFVPYELAIKLKELGFDEPCFMTYLNGKLDKELFLFNHSIRSHSTQEFTSAPLFQQTFRWFREKHNIDGLLHKTAEGSYYFWITECEYENYNHYKYYNQIVYFKTYEDAELACLDKLIEIVEGIENTK